MKLFVSSLVMLCSVSAFAGKQEEIEKLESLLFSTSKIQVEKNDKLVSLLKCIRKNVRSKNFDLDKKSYSTSLLSSILTQGTLSDDSRIMLAEEACRNQTKIIHEADLVSIDKAEAVIEKMINPTFVCKSYSGEISAAVLVGAGVGGAVYQCHGTDASVRLYAGPKFLASVGLGVNATVQKRTEWDNRENKVEKEDIFPVMIGAEFKYGIILAKSVDVDSKGIGLGVNYDGFATLTARVGALRSRYHVIQKFLEE